MKYPALVALSAIVLPAVSQPLPTPSLSPEKMMLEGLRSAWQGKSLHEQLALFPRVSAQSSADGNAVEKVKTSLEQARVAAFQDLAVAEAFIACKDQGKTNAECGFEPGKAGSRAPLTPSEAQNKATLAVLKAFYLLELGPAGRQDLKNLEARLIEFKASNPRLGITVEQVLNQVQTDIATNYIFGAGLVDFQAKVEQSTALSERDKQSALEFIQTLPPVLSKAYEPPLNLANCVFKFKSATDLEACVAAYKSELNTARSEIKAASKELQLSPGGKLQLYQILKTGPAANLVFMMGLR